MLHHTQYIAQADDQKNDKWALDTAQYGQDTHYREETTQV